MENLLLWGFYLLTFYAFLPGLISRIFGFRVFKRGKVKEEIALTFDDGPDPRYTPLLLDLLAKHGAKATFFVVGANAQRHPELLKRMHEEGHAIGIHNYVHKSNWLMRPKSVKKQIHRTSDVIKKVTGVRTTLYRPPWGIVNLFDFSNMGHLQIILWSAMFGDWRKRLGIARLTKRMMRKLRPGEVLLLHDCGTTFGADQDAPMNMLAALEAYLAEGKKQGYRFITVSEMIALSDQPRSRIAPRPLSRFKRIAVGLWLGWEKLFHLLFHLESVDKGQAIFHFRIRAYKGEPLQLEDGRQLQRNDKIIELHFDNRKLFEIMNQSKSLMQMAILVIREVEKALPKLAKQIAGRSEFNDVRGLYGISMINRGSESFGFRVSELPEGWFSRMTKVYLKILLRVLHPAGARRVRDKQASLVPRILLMSMEEFHRRYDALSESSPLSKHQRSRNLSIHTEETARELVP